MDTTPITGRMTFAMCPIHTRIEETCMCETPFAGELEEFYEALPTHYIAESALSPEYIALENATRRLFIANQFKLEKKRATVRALQSEVSLVSVTSTHTFNKLALKKLKREHAISKQLALVTEESQMREHTINKLREELARVTEQSETRERELAELKSAIRSPPRATTRSPPRATIMLKPTKTIAK